LYSLLSMPTELTYRRRTKIRLRRRVNTFRANALSCDTHAGDPAAERLTLLNACLVMSGLFWSH
jgi:hypothetical protein